MLKTGFKINKPAQNSIDQATVALDSIFHSNANLKTTSQIRLEGNTAISANAPLAANITAPVVTKAAAGPVWGNFEQKEETNLENKMNNLNISKPNSDVREAPEEPTERIPLGRLSSFEF